MLLLLRWAPHFHAQESDCIVVPRAVTTLSRRRQHPKTCSPVEPVPCNAYVLLCYALGSQH